MKILHILSCKNCHIPMNAESSVFNSVTCTKLGLLEPSLSTMASPKTASHLSSYSSYSPPPHIYSFFSLSLPLPLNLSVLPPLASSWLLPFSPLPTPHLIRYKRGPCLRPREQRIFPPWEGGKGSIQLQIPITLFFFS